MNLSPRLMRALIIAVCLGVPLAISYGRTLLNVSAVPADPVLTESAEGTGTAAQPVDASLGREVAVARHLVDGEEFELSPAEMVEHGKLLFMANWTTQEGAGRPLSKGTGKPLSDPNDPLVFPRNFNRVSGPDSNSCYGCHNAPFGVPGGGGDFVTNVFVLGQRFDFATFDASDTLATKGTLDEQGEATTLQNIANLRATVGMFGSGYVEMLARQISADLQAIRDEMAPGEARALRSKGIDYGLLVRAADGSWDTSRAEGLSSTSLKTTGADDPPDLIVRPFHQASAVVSLREFSNNAFNHHHGIQSAERFGEGADPDGDGFVNEMTRADVTAVSLFQAAMAVPGRVIPNHPEIERAVLNGETLFESIGCGDCHMAQLPLDNEGWIFSEPNPYNPEGNLRPGDAPAFELDLSSTELPLPRLQPQDGVVYVPVFSDFKLHDITGGRDDDNHEYLDMHAAPNTEDFTAGNFRFITRRLWGVANEPPYFHHGLYTTLRDATLAHDGEALGARQAFESLSEYDRNSIIEFLKTLQILPPGTPHLVVDEHGNAKTWPPQ